jgi:hypothetical protein
MRMVFEGVCPGRGMRAGPMVSADLPPLRIVIHDGVIDAAVRSERSVSCFALMGLVQPDRRSERTLY